MRSPSLLFGPKILKTYFEDSNRKTLLYKTHINSDFEGGTQQVGTDGQKKFLVFDLSLKGNNKRSVEM